MLLDERHARLLQARITKWGLSWTAFTQNRMVYKSLLLINFYKTWNFNPLHLFAPLDLDPMIHKEADQTIQNKAIVPQILDADRWDHLCEPKSSTHLLLREPDS
jgi:hypothetical protein